MDINSNQNQSSKDKHVNNVNCTVNSCAYNNKTCCCAKEIQVGPTYASACNDTLCKTFKQR